MEKPEPSSRQKREAELVMREETLGDRITDRMYSRLHEMCRVIQMQGGDFRRLASAIGNGRSLEPDFFLYIIRVRTQDPSELRGYLEARSQRTGVNWSSLELPWDQLCRHLSHLGLTKSHFEKLQSVLLTEGRVHIGGLRQAMALNEHQLRAMQMNPTTATKS